MAAIAKSKSAYKDCSACELSYADRQHYVASTVFIGVFKTGKYSEFDLELRNCKCGSTLAVYTDKENSINNIPALSKTRQKSSRKRLKSSPKANLNQLEKR